MDWSLLDYKLAFTHCSGEVLDYEIPTTSVLSVGKCLRDLHPVSFIAQELRRAWDKDICLPSQVFGALNLIRLLNYNNEKCLCCCTSRKHTWSSTQLLFCDSCQCSVFTCLICCFIWKYWYYSICSISYQLKRVLDVDELGTRPCFHLFLEFGEFTPSSAVADVSGYYVCLDTVGVRHFLSKLSCVFL